MMYWWSQVVDLLLSSFYLFSHGGTIELLLLVVLIWWLNLGDVLGTILEVLLQTFHHNVVLDRKCQHGALSEVFCLAVIGSAPNCIGINWFCSLACVPLVTIQVKPLNISCCMVIARCCVPGASSLTLNARGCLNHEKCQYRCIVSFTAMTVSCALQTMHGLHVLLLLE
jgi:hypothetical protein